MLKKFYANPTAIFLIIFTVCGLGIAQFLSMPIALYPMATKPELRVGINTNDMGAAEFKERFTKDLENAILSVDGVDKVEGRYRNGNSRLTVTFDWGIDPDIAKTDVKSAIDTVRQRFPKHWNNPWYRLEGGSDGRTFVTVKSAKYPVAELERRLADAVLPELKRLDSMERAFVWRIYEKHVQITVKPEKLLQFNLSYNDIQETLSAHEYNLSLGDLDIGEAGRYQVRATLKTLKMEDLRNLVVGYHGKSPIHLRDISTVELRQVDLEEISKGNGERKVLIGGTPKPDANLKNFAGDVLATIEKKALEIDPEMEIEILLNPSTFINEAVQNVLIAVLIGMLVATLVVFVFLRSLRNTLVIGISIPLSLIAGFVLMKLLGIGVNLISLGAMALAVGMVVDGAIVVLENITRHLEIEKPIGYKNRLHTIANAVTEVKLPIVASLLTTIIVFAPLPFTSPLANAILGDLAVVMVCVLSLSLAVTIFIIPGLILFFGVGSDKSTRGIYLLPELFNRAFSWLSKKYLSLVSAFLYRQPIRLSAVGFVALLFISGTYIVATQVPKEIMGVPDTDKLWVWMDFKDDYAIDICDEIATEVEKKMIADFRDDISHTFSEVSKNGTWILATLKDKSQVKRIKKEFEDYFKNTPELSFYIGTWTPSALKIPDPPVVEVNIAGADDEERRNTLETVANSLNDLKEKLGRQETLPRTSKVDYLNVAVKQDAFDRLRYSLNPRERSFNKNEVYQAIAGYLNQQKVFEMTVNKEVVDVDLRLPKDLIKSPGELENLLVRVDQKVIPIKTFATINHERDFKEYRTENGSSITRFQVWAKKSYEGSREDLRTEILAALKGADVDQSKLSFSDTDIEINDNINSLMAALAIALGLICILITLQFGNLIRASIIMIAIPFGFIGVCFALWIFSSAVNVNSMLGLILLCGTAVNNSIIFLDFYNRQKEEGLSTNDAILSTARIRFRPIMITTCTTILGMLPIAVGFGSGGEILQPLGIAVCGGLGISTILTLLLLPVTIQKVEGISERWQSQKLNPEIA